MKNEPLFKLLGAAIIGAVILAFASAARAADPTPAPRDLRDGTTLTVSRSGGVVTRTLSRATASGQTIVAQSERSWDQATRTATITGWSTRPGGARVTFRRTITRLAPGSFRETATFTGPDGRQRSVAGTRTRVGPGVWQIQREVTSADGRKTERSVTETRSNGLVTRVETTRHPDGTVTTRTRQSPARGRLARRGAF